MPNASEHQYCLQSRGWIKWPCGCSVTACITIFSTTNSLQSSCSRQVRCVAQRVSHHANAQPLASEDVHDRGHFYSSTL
ncbi:hypothetical protein CH063_11651 [Colletotrichum higginsianum]|uniref:Uncharacterized protein n=1 Tax=Colletotrichum higginsianum (strain IMI 349063) TaxID=759273 RepID=H1VM87_COLHI|nr:hypothetical protein CH063_11651 [Colletotrichum higginsianum]